MRQYQQLASHVLSFGDERMDRTGVGTYALFHQTLKFELSAGFPAVTVKSLAFGLVKKELAWFLSGDRSIESMQADECRIWDGNVNAETWQNNPLCDAEKDAGRVYGVQWRAWRGPRDVVDQLRDVVDRIKSNPADRRLVVTAWNPGELDEMCLPPCHMFFQFFVRNGQLDCAVYMRSVDVMLGLPFDIASYALLTHIVAAETGLTPGRLYFTLGDTHIYNNHREAAKTMIVRSPRQAPQLELDPHVTIDNFTWDMARLLDYNPHEAIAVELNV